MDVFTQGITGYKALRDEMEVVHGERGVGGLGVGG